MCGPNERAIANDIVKYSDSPRVFSMADQPLDLGTAKACIRRGRLMVSTDSGPRHVAAALGKPVITLYGPMLPVWSENPTQRAINLIARSGLHRLSQANLPAGTSSLHARPDPWTWCSTRY